MLIGGREGGMGGQGMGKEGEGGRYHGDVERLFEYVRGVAGVFSLAR